MNNLFIIIFI